MLKRSDLKLTESYLERVDIKTTVRIAKALAVYSVLESQSPTKLDELEREARLENTFSFADISGTILKNL
ncbi:hypothetical protein [Enterococcus sp.]|uniref:hypothetical protein n=1 Tax=Enterococcus sp. TaxID=35783 RepID=UPI002FC9B417